jgi:fermentation-respiration switch protein FrsA (DUF1100 family)
MALVMFALASAAVSWGADYERKDVMFSSQGLKCAAWYYVPTGLKEGEKRPAIVMAHGFSAVKEMYLDNFASKFASTGFVVTVFDYRFFGGSEGEPRAQLLWPEQIQDYRNAITWTMAQKEVDPARIGVWGTSYSGGHVIFLGAYDRRIKAVVAQVPVTDVWDTYMAKWPQQQREGFLGWLAQNRAEEVATGKLNYIAVAAPPDQPSVWPMQEWYESFMELSKPAPAWLNKMVINSLDTHMTYAPTSVIHRVSPTPLLMVIASNDDITPTAEEKEAFARANEPKKLVVVEGRHFEAYKGPKHDQFATPALDWFKTHLMGQ